ncbi:DUF6747 family protein [Aurantibacter crassamenti]
MKIGILNKDVYNEALKDLSHYLLSSYVKAFFWFKFHNDL